MDSDGKYPTNMTVSPNTPTNWAYTALIDKMNTTTTASFRTADTSCPTTINNIAVSLSSTLTTAPTDGYGFFVCASANAKIAHLSIRRGTYLPAGANPVNGQEHRDILPTLTRSG